MKQGNAHGRDAKDGCERCVVYCGNGAVGTEGWSAEVERLLQVSLAPGEGVNGHASEKERTGKAARTPEERPGACRRGTIWLRRR